MKKFLVLVMSIILTAGLLAGCGGSSSGTLNLYTWAGMFPQEVLDSFTEETGIEVNYVTYDTGETMLTKLDEAEGGDYDLVITDDYIMESVIANGLAQELDKSIITNIENVNPNMMGLFYDPEDMYTVPYGAGLQTIVYDPSKVDMEITGYADLWDSSLEDRIGIIGNYRVINGLVLKINGESYNTQDLDAIAGIEDQLMDLAPNIRLIKDDNIQDDLLSGEIDVAIMYTSQVTMAKMANPDLEIVFPEEGLGFGTMPMFIPSQAPNAEAANKFIEYVLRPEVAKQCFEFLGYYCTTEAAYDLIDESMKDLLVMPENMDGAESIRYFEGEANDLHVTIFNKFKEAAGQ